MALTPNTIPKATDGTHVGDSRISEDPGSSLIKVDTQGGYSFQAGDVTGNGGTFFFLNVLPDAFDVGDFEGPANVDFTLNAATQRVFIQAKDRIDIASYTGSTRIGDVYAAGHGTMIIVDDLNQLIKLIGVPTSDPHVVNALYNDAGTLKISAG